MHIGPYTCGNVSRHINLHIHSKQMGVSPISSYATGETINTLSAPSTNRLAESPPSQKKPQPNNNNRNGDRVQEMTNLEV